MKTIYAILLFSLAAIAANAQCALNPTITGDTMLCPNTSGQLTTQAYDSYQWYQRGFSDTTYQLMPGDTLQTLAIDHFNNSGYYYAVEVTDDTCTEMSPEKLVDGWAFLSPFVETTGDYTIGDNGETIICEGDTVYYTLYLPYDTLINWFRDGNVLEDHNPTLAVTDSGNYTVSGAPKLCPNYIEQLGVTLVTEVIDCGTGVQPVDQNAWNCCWSLSDNAMHIKNIPAGIHGLRVTIYSLDGKMMKQETLTSEAAFARLDFAAIPTGNYICRIQYDGGVVAKKLAVVR